MTMMTWGLSVVELVDGDRWSMAVAQPDGADQYDALAVRFKQAGLKRVGSREWNGGLWPLTGCSVSVLGGRLVEAHTGRSRLLCQPPVEVSAAWEKAGTRGRVVLGLVHPGTFPSTREGFLLPEHLEHAVELVEAEAAAGRLLAGLATLLDHPAPAPGRR
ncbi:hypothetical protein ACGF0D_42935 [Kitasatospora sp. NPDC048298]|uniref:hypothetical protein n=1 Tax=Kitasatospora sp. NPDC048298 TaxID=3364049 RepID=UPI0037119EAA